MLIDYLTQFISNIHQLFLVGIFSCEVKTLAIIRQTFLTAKEGGLRHHCFMSHGYYGNQNTQVMFDHTHKSETRKCTDDTL